MAEFNLFLSINYTNPKILERAKGIEPSSLAWEAKALPLSYARDQLSLINACALVEPPAW